MLRVPRHHNIGVGAEHILRELTGSDHEVQVAGRLAAGDVLTPDHGVTAIGSGGNYALSAALALAEHTEMGAEDIARKAMQIAAEICVYTNSNVTLEAIELD